MTNSETYTFKDQKAELKEEQDGMSRDDVLKLMQERSEYQLDLDNLKPQEHRWVDRGAVMSCEGAAHPSHRSYKRV